MIDHDKLNGLHLQIGCHESPDSGLCLMEAVAWVQGIKHTDHPRCVSLVLAEMGRSLNDVLPDDLRQLLVPLIPDLPGTAGDGLDETRAYLALDWLVREWLPAWLDLVPTCRLDAAKVRELDRIVDLRSAKQAGPVVATAEFRATTAFAACTPAGDAAYTAVIAATGAGKSASLAVAAAKNTTWSVAWAAAWSAAWTVARTVARAALEIAAATWVATVARTAAKVAADVAADAAADAAARTAIQSTVLKLQYSAIELYGHMVNLNKST